MPLRTPRAGCKEDLRFLVDVDDQVWLTQLGREDLTTNERRALVTARRNGAITPRELREIAPEADAGAVLAGAVVKGLLARIGQRGGSRYVLSEEVVLHAGSAGMATWNRPRQTLLDDVRRRGSISAAEAALLIDATPATARGLPDELMKAGLVQARGKTRARRYHLR